MLCRKIDVIFCNFQDKNKKDPFIKDDNNGLIIKIPKANKKNSNIPSKQKQRKAPSTIKINP
jgi:hypothetical protein